MFNSYWKTFLAVCAALVLSTAYAGNKGSDGYVFQPDTTFAPRMDFEIEMIVLPSKEAMAEVLAKRNRQIVQENDGSIVKFTPRTVMAFAVVRTGTTKCTIYMVDPKVAYMPEYYGHELLHCMYGDWHKGEY